MTPKPLRGQRSLPFQSKEEALADMYERLVRIESKISKIALALGLDENGRPTRSKPPKFMGQRMLEPTD